MLTYLTYLCKPENTMSLHLKKNRTRTLKSILEKMHPVDTNLFAYNVIDKYENRPDNLH